MGVITRYGKPLLDAKGKPRRDKETGEALLTPHKHLKTRIPGWGEMRKGTDTTSDAVAREYDSMVKALGRLGAVDVLDALNDDKLTFAKALGMWGGGDGLAGIRAHLKALDARPMSDRLIEPLVENYIENGSLKKKTRRGQTKDGYRTHMVRLIQELGGSRRANLSQLLPLEASDDLAERKAGPLEQAFEAVYYERLADNVSLRECGARRDEVVQATGSLSQSQWKKMRADSLLELTSLDLVALDERAEHADRTAAGATANRHKATWKGFLRWVIANLSTFRAASGSTNVAALVPDYEEKHEGEAFFSVADYELFRATSLEIDGENPVFMDVGGEQVRVLDVMPVRTLLWDMLRKTGASTYTEMVNAFSIDQFKPGTRTRAGKMQVEIIGTKNARRSTRTFEVDAELYDRSVALAAEWGIAHNQPIFAPMLGGSKDLKRIYRAFNAVCARVARMHGRPDFMSFNPYSLRHTFAVWKIQGAGGEQAVDITRLQYLMGHTDITTTSRYAKYRGDANAASVIHNGPHEGDDPLQAAAQALGLTREQLVALAAARKAFGM